MTDNIKKSILYLGYTVSWTNPGLWSWLAKIRFGASVGAVLVAALVSSCKIIIKLLSDLFTSSLTEGREVFVSTLIKKKIEFSSYIRKFRRELLQSLIWLTASSNMTKYLRISSYLEALPHIWLCNRSRLNFLIYEENLIFFFISVYGIFWPPVLKRFSRNVI